MSSRSDGPDGAQEAIQRAREHLEAGDGRAALEGLRAAYEERPGHAQIRSYYGLCLGLEDRRYHEAIELCQSAVQQEFFNPELYLNVARLNLAFGFKAEGLRFLRRAGMIDPASPGIEHIQRELGLRADPVFSFLPRQHLVNRWLGSLRHLLTSAMRAPDRAAADDSSPEARSLEPRGTSS
jgi:tetratricopeptide (TPR) repeat protein